MERGKKGKSERRSGGVFIGVVEIMPLIDRDISKEFQVAFVTFPAGTRNKFHIHDPEQILYVIDGENIVVTEEVERVVTVGDIFLIPDGENH